MTEENLEIVRRCFDAFTSGDVDALVSEMAPDVEMRSVITQTEKEIYHGHAGVREWYPAAFEVFPDWTPKAVEVRDFGDAVLVTSDVTGTGAASGVHYTERFWLAVTLRDGKISWFGFHRSEEEALAALEERGRR